MSKRNLVIIAVVLGVFALAIHLFSDSKKGGRDSRIGTTLASSDLVESIDDIVLEKGTTTVHLQKLTNMWQIKEKEGYPARVVEILLLLQKITTYKIASIVTENPERLAYFGLLYKAEAESQTNVGSQLTLMAGKKPIYKLLLGKHRDSISKSSDAPSYPDGTYVRIGDSKSVFLIKENLDLNVDVNSWMEKKLATIEDAQIKAIRYETQKDRLVLSRESKEKKLVLSGLRKDEKTSDFERSTILNELKEFTIDDILPRNQEFENGLELRSAIQVELFDQSTFDFQIFVKPVLIPLKTKEGKSQPKYYLKLVPASSDASKRRWQALYSLADNWIFEIEEWRAKKWLKTRKDFAIPSDKTE